MAHVRIGIRVLSAMHKEESLKLDGPLMLALRQFWDLQVSMLSLKKIEGNFLIRMSWLKELLRAFVKAEWEIMRWPSSSSQSDRGLRARLVKKEEHWCQSMSFI